MPSAMKLTTEVRATEIVIRHWEDSFRTVNAAHNIPADYQMRHEGVYYSIADLRRLPEPFTHAYVAVLESRSRNWLGGLASQFVPSVFVEVTLTGHASGEVHGQIRVDFGQVRKTSPFHEPEFQQELIEKFCQILRS